MRNFGIILLIGVLLAVLESGLSRIIPLPFRPDMILAMTVFVSFHIQPIRGLVLAFLFGYVLDILSGHPVGLHTISMICVFSLAKGVPRHLYYFALPVQVGLIIPFFFMNNLVLSLISGIFMNGKGPLSPPLGILFIQLVVTVVISPFLFKGLQRILAEAVVQG